MNMPIPDEVPGDLKLAGDVINAAQDVIDKISSFLPAGARGIVIQISNMTGLTLALKTTDFSSGGLEPSVLPAPVVGPFSQTVFGVKSVNRATAVVGSVIYESDGIDALLCGFNNPPVGINAVNATLSGSLAPVLSCRAVIGSGNQAAANFVLFDTGGFGIGDTVSLISLGAIPGARYLDGRTADGTVGLAPNAEVPFTDARWQVSDGGGGSFTLKSLSKINGPCFLNGKTADGSVGLAVAPGPAFTGTHWEITKLDGGVSFSVRCLASIEGPRFLDGRTDDGTIRLAPSVRPPFTGTHWGIFRRQIPTT
jgi:hypothetical protein